MYTRVKKSAELTMARLAPRYQMVRRKEIISSSTNASRDSSLSKEDLETALYLPLYLPDENSALNLSMDMVVVLCKWRIDSNAAAHWGKVRIELSWTCGFSARNGQDRRRISSEMLDGVKEDTRIVPSK